MEALTALVAPDLKAVNDLIVRRMHSPVAMIPQLAGYIIAAGGKRLRPVLTLAAARLCGYTGQRHHALAACVEFIHTATLLHDDVVDESLMRRGQASANAVFGNQASVLVGDFLFSRAFQLMVEDGSLEVLGILSRASAVIAEGEVLQLSRAHSLEMTQQDYLEIVTAKTAELFAAACQVGAVVADRPATEVAALRRYGLALGMAFQMADDVLDYRSGLGKSPGDDFREGKVTLPVLLAFHAGDDQEKAFWKQTMEDKTQKDGDLEHAQALLVRRHAPQATLDMARQHTQQAWQTLNAFPDSPARQALTDILDFVVNRAR
ncbi:MAG: polyprenyl synthetase family protein [Pseudomonadota bacterium]|nr:polyprenyl synthetase family protein [Pseudomonadota bacterium]